MLDYVPYYSDGNGGDSGLFLGTSQDGCIKAAAIVNTPVGSKLDAISKELLTHSSI